jgi:NitT/TauT family transport system substrate-binding protein
MFEPGASEYQKAGKGYVVASMGEFSGEIPYTSFIALDNYMKENPEIIKAFLRSIKRGMDYVLSHTDSEVATAIKGQFSTDSMESLTTSIASYRRINAWKTDLIPTENSYDRLQDIMEYAGELTSRKTFNELVDLTYVNAVKN